MIAQLEAILFAYGEPMAKAKLQKMLGVSETELNDAIGALRTALEGEARGLMLLEHADTLQLVTKPAHHELVGALVKAEFQEALTPAALETASIVAYAGPVARSEVDYIRGVNSSFIIRSLLIRGLVERVPHPDRANVYRYRASAEFLRHMGVARREDLPQYASFQEIITRLRTASTRGTAEPT